jgi:hypothetical protein
VLDDPLERVEADGGRVDPGLVDVAAAEELTDQPFISAWLVPGLGARWTPPVRAASRAASVVLGSTQTITGGSSPRGAVEDAGPEHGLRLGHVAVLLQEELAAGVEADAERALLVEDAPALGHDPAHRLVKLASRSTPPSRISGAVSRSGLTAQGQEP